MKFMQLVSRLFFVFGWSTPLGRVSRDFMISWCLVFKAKKGCKRGYLNFEPGFELGFEPGFQPGFELR